MDAIVILARTLPAAFWIVVALIVLCVIVSLPAILFGMVIERLVNRTKPNRAEISREEDQTLPYRVGRAYRKLTRLATFLPFG